MALGRVGAAAVAAAFAAACQYTPDIGSRAVEYNHVVARTTNQIILLNIVRAAKREPRYFTRLGTDNAQAGISGSAAVTLPFPIPGSGSGGIGAAGSSANTFTLDNLDDKKYQDGAMQPVAASAIRDLWAQGVQGDLLGLLFFNSIAIPEPALAILRESVARFCGDMRHPQKFCGTGPSLIASEPIAGDWTADDCLDPARIPITRRGNADFAVYYNDPAAENPAGSYHPELCFQIVLRDLLALGLHLEKRITLQDIDRTAIENTLSSPDYRAEILKEGLKVSKDGRVQKEVTEIVLTLDPAAVALYRMHPSFRDRVLQCGVYARTGVKPDETLHCPPVRGAGESDVAWRKRMEADSRDYAALVTGDEIKAWPVGLKELNIFADVRSFEGLIYYLGEVVRTQQGATGAAMPYVVRVLGRAPGDMQRSMYEETMFDLRNGAAEGNAAIVLNDDTDATHWVPAACYFAPASRPAAGGTAQTCSDQFPDHDTMTVLALVNQVWGLQKEPSPTATPILTLGG